MIGLIAAFFTIKIRSSLYWTTSVFSSVWLTWFSSSASAVRSLTLHSWTPFYNSGRTEERPPPRTFRLFRPLLRNLRQSRGDALISTSVFVVTKRAFSEPLSSNGQFRHSNKELHCVRVSDFLQETCGIIQAICESHPVSYRVDTDKAAGAWS
jgi:hypothetical protein